MEQKEKLVGFDNEEFKEKVNPINQELVEDFLKQSHLSDQTLKQYKSGLNIFCKWVYDECKNAEIPSLKPRQALRFQNFLIDKGLSSSAIKFKRSAVSSLFNFIEVYWLDEYPTCRNIFTKAIPNVSNKKVKEKIPLTKIELKILIDELRERNEYQKLAFLLVAYSSAGRRAEVIQLKKEIINYQEFKDKKGENKGFYLSHIVRGKGKGKGGKDIKLMISIEAMDAVKTWIEETGENNCEYIFVSKHGSEYKQISANTINLWVDYFGKIVGRKIFPHLLRASRSTHLVVDDGKDVRFAQKLLNHESSETTTNHYVIRDDSEDFGDIF